MRALLFFEGSVKENVVPSMLTSVGFICHSHELNDSNVEINKLQDYDIIVVDLGSNGMPGYELLKKLRMVKNDTPILIMSDSSGIGFKIEGFNAGADDCLTKPFDEREFIARIQALVRRFRGHSTSIVEVGKMRVNLEARTVEIDDCFIHLTATEYKIIELLSMRRGTILAKLAFIQHLYEGAESHDETVIDVFICNLRKKLSNNLGGDDYIETVWGYGYRLRDPLGINPAGGGRIHVGQGPGGGIAAA